MLVINKALALVLVPLVLFSASIGVFLYRDEISVLVNSWLNNNPQVLVKLKVKLPSVDADMCFVAVHRFETPYVPVNERLFAGMVAPGVEVEVKKLIPAIPVKLRYDERTKQYVVEYYEPQQFFILVHCVKGNTTVFKYGRVYEVFPRSIIHQETIEIQGSSKPPRLSANLIDGGGGSTRCEIYQINDPNDPFARGECRTWVLGPYLYSIEGLRTRYGIAYAAYARAPSAIYLTAFYDSVWCPPYCDPNQITPNWKEAGKVLTESLTDKVTDGLTGNSKVRVAFDVAYRHYLYDWCDGVAGVCVFYWLLAPYRVYNVLRADGIGLGYVEYYSLPQHPSYAQITYGDEIHWFEINQQTDEIIVTIAVGFSCSFEGWSAVLSVSFYKAVRNDNQYVSPFVKIEDLTGRTFAWYYWWYKDNDQLNLEILVSDW
jgi:hypothetical protein